MDGEMSTGMRIAVTLLVVGAVLSIVIVTIAYGQDFYRYALSSISNGVGYTYAAELEALSLYDEPLPAPGVYVALKKTKAAILNISGSAHGINVNTIDDIQRLFKHQISVTVTKNGELYDVVIGP